MFSESILRFCYSLSIFSKVQISPKRQDVTVLLVASGEAPILKKKFWRSTSPFQYKRTTIKRKCVSRHLRSGDEVYLEGVIPSLHRAFEEKCHLETVRQKQNSGDNFVKRPVVGTSEETPSFEGDDIESCRVPKTNLDYDECLLFQSVGNDSNTGNESLKKH